MRPPLLWIISSSVLVLGLWGFPQGTISEAQVKPQIAKDGPTRVEQPQDNRGKDESQPPTQVPTGNAPATGTTERKDQCYAEEKPNECANRLIQQQVAWFTELLAMVGVLQLVVAAVQSGFILKSVRISTKATTAAERSAKASLKQAKLMRSQLAVAKATVPRAWLYAEFNEPGPKVTTQGGNTAVIPLSIRNHGTTPATIKQVDLRYYFGGFDDGKILDPEQELVTTPFEIGEIGKPTAPIPGAVECKFESSPYVFDGTTISPNQSAPEGPRKIPLQIRYPVFKQSGHAGFRGRESYIFIIITYSDPNGTDRETGYLGHVRANDLGQIVESNDPRYSYHR